VDDVGKVREKDGFALIPTDQLKPEFAYNAEATVEKTLFSQKVQVSLTGFYTLLKDAIVQRNASLNGQDSIEVEGTLAQIQTNQNASQAFIYGYFAGVTAELTDRINAFARYNFTYGQDTEFDVPLAHIPPAFASAGLKYNYDGFQGEVSALYNAKKPIDRYAPGSTDNPDAALADGVPAWWTLNLNATYFITRTLQAQFGLENLLDVHYRTFASGISAPGRNLILGVRAAF
jgi:hemoglobin/transferrin/lactoferrin receptor protein